MITVLIKRFSPFQPRYFQCFWTRWSEYFSKFPLVLPSGVSRQMESILTLLLRCYLAPFLLYVQVISIFFALFGSWYFFELFSRTVHGWWSCFASKFCRYFLSIRYGTTLNASRNLSEWFANILIHIEVLKIHCCCMS